MILSTKCSDERCVMSNIRTPEPDGNKASSRIHAPAQNGSSRLGSQGDHDIFRDPSLAGSLGDAFKHAASEDPFFGYVAKWWKHVLVAALALATFFYARSVFNQTYLNSMAGASEIFSSATAAYAEFTSKKGELEKLQIELASSSQESSKAEIEQKVKTATQELKGIHERAALAFIALRDTRSPYVELADSYLHLLNFEAQEFKEADFAVDTDKILSVSEVSGYRSAEPSLRLIAEAQALLVARQNLDSDRDAAIELLKDLIRNGQYVHGAAGLTLALLAENSQLGFTPEQRQETVQLLKELQIRAPEQSQLLEGEINRLSVE